MFGLPSPGQVVQAIGGVMQSAEQFVSAGVNNTIAAIANTVENHDPRQAQPVVVNGANGTQVTQQVSGVVSAEDFNRFMQQVANAFSAVREDIASIRALGPTGDGSGGLYEQQNGGGGSNSGGIDPMMLVLLLQPAAAGGTAAPIDTTTLLLLTMSGGLGGGGNSRGGGTDILDLMFALGRI